MLKERRKSIGYFGMNQNRRAGARRFTVAALVALTATALLFYLMTRLILPDEYQPIVSRTIQRIEFERVNRPFEETDIPVFEKPQDHSIANSSPQIEINDTSADESSEEEGRVREFDWQSEKRRLAQETDDKAFERWLLEQGHQRYVSIMQGPLPITDSVHATLPPNQEDISGYMNVYGDKEYKISENCVATTQIASRLDHSDFARALPMIITCKSRRKQKITFDRHGRE